MKETEVHADLPRIVIAGTSSGGGKTTVTCALLGVFKKRGIRPAAFKCGPDYLDPMFHQTVIGVESANLDSFFLDENGLRGVLHSHAGGHDLAVIEGVMGYYDGTGKAGMEHSTFQIAQHTDSQVILVVEGRGASTSILAQIEGFLHFAADSRIAGVIVNRIGESSYASVRERIQNHFGETLKAVGYLPPLPEECVLESRHLGLVAAGEIADLKEKMERLTEIAEKSLDIEGILSVAGRAGRLVAKTFPIASLDPVKIAVARDRAFCFYYPDTLRLFQDLGAELVFFSPLDDEEIPEGSCGLYLGGGYPELHAKALSEAKQAKRSVTDAIQKGIPVIAECGGFMYLCNRLDGYPMCGVLPGECTKTPKLVRFGYVEIRALQSGLFGERAFLKGHEFHYWDCTENGADLRAEKTNGTEYPFGFYSDRMYAGYPHLYLNATPEAAEAFYQKCLRFREEMRADHDHNGTNGD